ncbi:mandelate racemase, partial [Acinetobacter baumannii]
MSSVTPRINSLKDKDIFMKIKRIELYQIDLPYSGGVYHLSGG